MSPTAHSHRVRTARKIGHEAGARAEAKAVEKDPAFCEKALAHFRRTVDALAPGAAIHGEDLVNSAKLAGIRPHDDRAFGPVFVKARNQGLLLEVGQADRVKGHGTAGGRLYARGGAA